MTSEFEAFFQSAQAGGDAEPGKPPIRTRIRPDDWEPEPEALAAGRGTIGSVLLGTHESNSAGWHALRASRLGGSEAAAIVGLSKWATPYTLWHRKAQAMHGHPELPEEDISDSPMIEWGNRLEEVVGNKLAENHPELGFQHQPGTYAHVERPWQLANPDMLGMTEDAAEFIGVEAPGGEPRPVIGEIKTAAYGHAWGPDGTDEIPLYYRCQCIWYMDVMGAEYAILCVLIGGNDYREYKIPFDLADALYLRGHGDAFMKSVRDGIEPPINGAFVDKDAVEAMWEPAVTGGDVQISPELAISYAMAVRDEKAAKANKATMVARIEAELRTERRAMLGATPIAARTNGAHGVYLRPDGKISALLTAAEHQAAPGLPSQETPDLPLWVRKAHMEFAVQLEWLTENAKRPEDIVAIVSMFGRFMTKTQKNALRKLWLERTGQA